ncbi:type II secretion system protein GspG, partial [Pedobacter sp.]|uniref:type II secretion system protein GspG n=1 Tax=Pedobacter sp. TaxID=1411316 RepID=UPI003D7FE4B7
EKVSLIPKSAFQSYTDQINFIGLIRSSLSKTRVKVNALPGNAYRKPPYLLGLLCAVPFVGAIVGLVFIYLGATRFKDKWFTLIGVFGVAFSVVVYLAPYYAGKNYFKVNDGIEKISKMQISNLVKDIEFYKIQHGVYPDSLKQLQLDDKSVFINDPTQAIQGRKSNLFNYLRVGDQYQLFSSGEDGIPGTEDDLYPQIPANMIKKTGLIKYELKPDTAQQKR